MQVCSRALLSLLYLFFSAQPVFAQTSVTDGVLINADSMFRDIEKKTVRLKGNVQMVFKGQHMSSDKALLDLNNQQVTAEGHVILYNEKTHVEGDKVVFNYHSNTGFIYNGFVQSGQVVFEGDVIEKIGEAHYIASNGEYTACETCPPGWSFSGTIIDAEIGGYAHIQRPVFHIGGVPVLILPSIIVPLKSARQSGVLVPGMDYSGNGGIAFSGTYFWAIDRSQDMTMTARWYKFRGYQVQDDYRYVLSKDSSGRASGSFLEDKLLENEYNPANTSKVDRYYLSYDHYYDLPNNFVQRANIRQVSDLRYTRDFPDEIAGLGDPALENKMSVTKTSENQYASIEGDLYTNLLKYYPFQGNDDAVHRLPEIKYSYKETRLFEHGPLVRFDLDYTNFASSKWNYDNMMPCPQTNPPNPLYCPSTLAPLGSTLGPTGTVQTEGPQGAISHSGSFNPLTNGDIQRTGQRLDMQPTISYPFQVARRFDLIPSVTYRETDYRFNTTEPSDVSGFPSTADRRYLETDIKARTEISRVYGNLDDPKGDRWKHSIEPEIGYSQTPWMQLPNHPFFGQFAGMQYSRQYDPISDSDVGNPNTGVQFDYNDRTFNTRVLTYSVDNRITRKVWNDGMADYKTLALFRVQQSYDLEEAERPHNHAWSSIDSLMDVRLDHFGTYTIVSYNPYAHVASTSTWVRGMLTPKNFLQVSFTQSYTLDQNDVVEPGQETRNFGLGTGFITRYVELIANIDYSDVTHQVQDWSYILNIRPPGRCWVIHFEQMQVFGGVPNIHAALSFDFGGETTSETSARAQAM